MFYKHMHCFCIHSHIPFAFFMALLVRHRLNSCGMCFHGSRAQIKCPTLHIIVHATLRSTLGTTTNILTCRCLCEICGGIEGNKDVWLCYVSWFLPFSYCDLPTPLSVRRNDFSACFILFSFWGKAPTTSTMFCSLHMRMHMQTNTPYTHVTRV